MGAYNKEKEAAVDIAKLVGGRQKDLFGKGMVTPYTGVRHGKVLPNAIGRKEARTTVSIADIISQEAALGYLGRYCSQDAVLSEEDTLSAKDFDRNAGQKKEWVVDPLDGSYSFTQNKPFFGVALGLRVDKKFVVSVIYAPMQEIMYVAAEGDGLCKFDKENPDGVPVQLADPPKSPFAGDRVQLSGNISRDVTTVLQEQCNGIDFHHADHFSSVHKTIQVLAGNSKAYLKYLGNIYGGGPEAFAILAAGGAFIDLDGKAPEWVERDEHGRQVPALTSYAILGPKNYSHELARLIHTTLDQFGHL
jgi:3'-phosphoadenosine 5'-phosphosulfate (PAPS) 3'-phosphatase